MALEPISFTPSRNIAAIAHDSETQTLYIRFYRGNRIYRYAGVTGEDAQGFGQSLSSNDYLTQYILPKYSSEPLGPDETVDF